MSGGLFKDVLKTVLGIVAIAVVISGLLLYFTSRINPIKYEFNPKSDYVYTFHRDLFTIEGRGTPEKKVTLFQDGFHPLCPFGCSVEASHTDLVKRIYHSPTGDANEGKSDYIFLDPDDAVIIEFDMRKGKSIHSTFPYVNRIMFQLKDDSSVEDISVSVESYPFEEGDHFPEDETVEETIFYHEEDFGDYLVFGPPRPSFVSVIKLGVKEGSTGQVGLKWVNAYLARSEFISTASQIERVFSGNGRGADGERDASLLERISSVKFLDPYSPKPDLLYAKYHQREGDYETALTEIEKSIDAANRYSQFLNKEVKVTDLYELRGRIASDMGKWDLAIDSMERTGPEVDHGFLVDVYLNKFLVSENEGHIDRAVRHAFLRYKETPRLILPTLRLFSARGLLGDTLTAVDRVIKNGDSGKITLETGEVVPSFVLLTTKSLLNFWQEGEGSDLQALELARESQEMGTNKEQRALTATILSLIYRDMGQVDKAKSNEKTAVDYFSNYAGLYDGWQSLLEEDGP